MKILFVTSKLNFVDAGGSVTDIDLKLKYMQEFGHTVNVITLYPHRNKIDRELPYPYAVEEIGTHAELKVMWRLAKILRKYENDYDIFHVEGQYMYASGLYRLLGGSKPVVLFFNREYISWPSETGDRERNYSLVKKIKFRLRLVVEKYILSFFANRNDGLIFSTPYLRDAFYAFGVSSKIPVEIMIDYVNYDKMRMISGLTIEETRIKRSQNKPFQIYTTGRIIAEKGFDIMIEAFAHLKDKEKFRLGIGGDGPERLKLIELVKQKGLEKYIDFPGWIAYEDMVKRLNGSNIFVLPRWRKEIEAVILIESLSLGLPCLVQSGGGFAWLVGNPDLIFEDRNPADLARKIERIAVDPELEKKLGAYCFDRMNTEFSIPQLAKRLEGFLLETATRK